MFWKQPALAFNLLHLIRFWLHTVTEGNSIWKRSPTKNFHFSLFSEEVWASVENRFQFLVVYRVLDFDVNVGGGAEHVGEEGEERPARPKKIRPRVTLREGCK